MTVRAISFDLFDTLVDLSMESLPEFELAGKRRRGTLPALHRVVEQRASVDFERFGATLDAVDRDLREPRAREGLELPTVERFTELLARLGLRDPELAESLTRVHMAELERQAHVPEHHLELLTRLRAELRLALCSNFSHAATARRILERAGMAGLFDVVVVSEEVRFRKPRPEIFACVQDALGLPACEILHVGDRLRADVGGAAAVGMPTAWLTRRVAAPEAELRAHTGARPSYVLTDLAELPPVLGLAA